MAAPAIRLIPAATAMIPAIDRNPFSVSDNIPGSACANASIIPENNLVKKLTPDSINAGNLSANESKRFITTSANASTIGPMFSAKALKVSNKSSNNPLTNAGIDVTNTSITLRNICNKASAILSTTDASPTNKAFRAIGTALAKPTIIMVSAATIAVAATAPPTAKADRANTTSIKAAAIATAPTPIKANDLDKFNITRSNPANAHPAAPRIAKVPAKTSMALPISTMLS